MSCLISEEYRDLNKELHERNERFGTMGREYTDMVRQIISGYDADNLLDYGCGKGTLKEALLSNAYPDFDIREYDPAIPGKEEPPEPADIVSCTDVFEHLEIAYLDNVLKDLQRLTRKALLVTVAMGPAKKTLADGRNAHLIQKDTRWWLNRILPYFRLRQYNVLAGDQGEDPYEFLAVLEPFDA